MITDADPLESVTDNLQFEDRVDCPSLTTQLINATRRSRSDEEDHHHPLHRHHHQQQQQDQDDDDKLIIDKNEGLDNFRDNCQASYFSHSSSSSVMSANYTNLRSPPSCPPNFILGGVTKEGGVAVLSPSGEGKSANLAVMKSLHSPRPPMLLGKSQSDSKLLAIKTKTQFSEHEESGELFATTAHYKKPTVAAGRQQQLLVPTLDRDPHGLNYNNSEFAQTHYNMSSVSNQITMTDERQQSDPSLHCSDMKVPFKTYEFDDESNENSSSAQTLVLPSDCQKQQRDVAGRDVFMEVSSGGMPAAHSGSLVGDVKKTNNFLIHPADLVNIDNRANTHWSSSNLSNQQCKDRMSTAGSNNTTENVRVYSSFHVAEIVGKQGVKIKKIRANTNTWIKTPARGQDPVFIISGRREGVEQAKAEILASNDKVSRLRELRGRNVEDCEQMDESAAAEGGVAKEGAVVVQVSVPSSAVGLVIGPKGSRIREIAEASNTYIKTPCRYREPVFEIYGHPTDVLTAKEQILSFVHDKVDDEYIKRWMAQMPIHQPGAPVVPGEPVATTFPIMPSSKALCTQADVSAPPANFTRLRPFGPRLMPTPIAAPLSPGAAPVFSELLPSYNQSPECPLPFWNQPTSRPASPIFPTTPLRASYSPLRVEQIPPSGRTTPTSACFAPSTTPAISSYSHYKHF